MEKNEFIVVFLFTSVILILVGGFLLFALIWYRKRTNTYILERDSMKNLYERQLLETRLEIQEQTLNHISQEIHDNVGQELSLTKIQLNIIEVSEGLSKEVLHDARESLSKAIIDLRDMAKSLSTDRIRNFNLAGCVEEEINRVRRSGLVQASFRIDGQERPIHEEKRLIVFRIIQECLQNILKHAGAAVASVCFCYEETGLRVIIADNGKGFNVTEAVGNRTGLGLNNIIQRAEIARGRAVVTSTLNGGTIVNIFMPYD